MLSLHDKRKDVEIRASLYHHFWRRDQIRVVEVCVASSDFTAQQQQDVESLSEADLIAHALASGDVDSVRQLLRQKGLRKPIETTFKTMRMIQRNVCGSETEKDTLLPKFFALRLWSGCSSLFFTLNPRDIRSPIIISV